MLVDMLDCLPRALLNQNSSLITFVKYLEQAVVLIPVCHRLNLATNSTVLNSKLDALCAGRSTILDSTLQNKILI